MLAPFATGETDFRQCPACGLLFRERFPSPVELEAIYEAAYSDDAITAGSTNQESGTYATTAYAEFIGRRFLKPGMSTLDFGAGTGALVTRLRKAGVRAEGFEFSESARAYCRSEAGFELMGDLNSIPVSAYDFISMIEVIEHLTDLPSTLGRLHAALKPGGVMLVTTPNVKGWRARLEAGHWREARKKFHLFLFDERSLRHHLAAAGFSTLYRIRWSPVLKSGITAWFIVRGTQLAMLGGSLCVVARRI